MKYFQNSLCVEALEANPRAFVVLATNYCKKKKKKRVSPIMKYTNADCTDSISQSVLERQHSHN